MPAEYSIKNIGRISWSPNSSLCSFNFLHFIISFCFVFWVGATTLTPTLGKWWNSNNWKGKKYWTNLYYFQTSNYRFTTMFQDKLDPHSFTKTYIGFDQSSELTKAMVKTLLIIFNFL